MTVREKWTQKLKMNNIEGFFVNICQYGNTWHVTSASSARLAHLGPQMKKLTRFRDPGG
jgi:hypothetical protein